jgi:hypothetical protein
MSDGNYGHETIVTLTLIDGKLIKVSVGTEERVVKAGTPPDPVKLPIDAPGTVLLDPPIWVQHASTNPCWVIVNGMLFTC